MWSGCDKKAKPKSVAKAPEQVPIELSLNSYVGQQWEKIESNAYQGIPYLHIINQLDRHIDESLDEFNNDNLIRGYDWENDYKAAVNTHKFRKDWLQHTLTIRNEYVGWWIDFIRDTNSQIQDITVEARKLLLLSHGAVILGSMAALASIDKPELYPAFLTVTIGGLIGFLLAAIGVVVHIESFGGAMSKLHGDFRSTHPMKRYSAYSRYLKRRIKKEVIWSVRVSYASLIALPIYSALAIAFVAFA